MSLTVNKFHCLNGGNPLLSKAFAGKFLTGINPIVLSPSKKLKQKQNYFFVHGEEDKRVLIHHFEYFKEYSKKNNINSTFWLVTDSYQKNIQKK